MAHYYFLGTLLPSLSLDSPPEISFEDFDTLLRDNLSKRDYEKTLTARRFFDLLNLRALWIGDEIDPRGEMSEQDILEALVSRTGLPFYVYEFLDRYPDLENRRLRFPFLLARYFQTGEELHDPFLKKYLNFERELRLVMTAFRAKKLGKDLSVEFQYENPDEELIAQLLAQKDAKEVILPERFSKLETILKNETYDPLALQKALDTYRFETIESWVDMADHFSIERILAYLLQLIIVENWFKADKVKGIQIVDTLVKER